MFSEHVWKHFYSAIIISAAFGMPLCATTLQAAQLPGKIEDRLPQDLDNKKILVPETTTLPPPPLREGRLNTFVLSAVEISGATVFAPEIFAPLYDKYLARSISLSDVTALIESITAMYRDEGYFLSRAVAPAQNTSSGTLHINIIEGYISEITIEGDTSATIKKRLDQLKRVRPLRIATLERTLALIGGLRGPTVASSEIEPDLDALAPHTLIVEIEIGHMDASLYTDNRGTNDAGPVQAYARIAGNSLFKTGGQLSVGVFFIPADMDELVLGEVNYHLPLTSAGTYASASGMISHFKAGASLSAVDTKIRPSVFH